MGIPSYYRKLIDQAPGLITTEGPVEPIEWFFMDYNCLIYQCLQADGLSDYSADTHDAWEAEFITEIVRYTREIIEHVRPSRGVYIAIDGVVPMAKMRQQRLRRWKSAHESEAKSEAWNPSVPAKAWNKNAITPGTVFMDKLAAALRVEADRSHEIQWILSTSNEPGEGEHKIMAAWRTWNILAKVTRIVVYGLDADLIVLSLLGREQWRLEKPHIWLFREAANVQSEHEHEWFSIDAMYQWITAQKGNTPVSDHDWIMQYLFVMSLLGNDFLPRSLSMTLREEGHSLLLEGLRVCNQRGPLATTSAAMVPLFQWLARHEYDRIKEMIWKRRRQMQHADPANMEHMPLFHRQLEDGLLDPHTWQERYMTRFFSGYAYTKTNRTRVCHDYLQGLEWIWAYYTGSAEVCYNWHYPHTLPPLWEWLSSLDGAVAATAAVPSIELRAADIQPTEQLALVLPLESWNLFPPGTDWRLRAWPKRAPYYFPRTTGWETVGRRYFWECEPSLPVPTMIELKRICSTF